MKKLLSTLLAVVLVFGMLAFTLASCGDEDNTPSGDQTPGEQEVTVETLNGKTPEQLYNEASTVISGYDNYTSVSTQEIIMEISGMKIKTKQSVVTKVTALLNASVEITSDSEMLYNGEWMPAGETDSSSVIIADGMLYTNIYTANNPDQQKLKVPVTEDNISSALPEGTEISGSVAVLPSEFFTGTAFIQNDDGTYTVKVTMSGAKYTEWFGQQGGYPEGMTIETVVHKINFNANGSLINIVTDLAMKYAIEGMVVDATAVSTTTFSNIGTTAPVTAPADADQYILAQQTA